MLGCLPTLSKRDWLLYVGLAGVNLGCGICASIQAPFYPQEAESKGASATEYGMVFGIFELVAFISYPIFGIYVGKLGASLVLKCGLVVAGSSIVVFGLLSLINDHWWFIGLSYLVRSIEALGTAAVVTASLAIVVAVFSESFARVLAMVDVMEALGYVIGPTVGGYLYEVGGFLCPFLVMGSFVLVTGAFIITTLPDLQEEEGKTQNTKTPLSSVLKIIPVSLDAVCMMVEAMSIGYITATLEPHLREFLLSPTALGALFIINGLVYTVCSPLVGILCDKLYNTKIMIMFGSLLTITSFLLIGPMPFTPWETSMTLVYIGLVIDGFGMSFMFIPAFVDAINSAVKYGLPNDINTYALVSGVYSSAFALGAFIGQSASGILFDAVGFRKGTLFIVAVHSLLFVAVTWFACVEAKYEKRMKFIRM